MTMALNQQLANSSDIVIMTCCHVGNRIGDHLRVGIDPRSRELQIACQ
jgi:hypothetical protein